MLLSLALNLFKNLSVLLFGKIIAHKLLFHKSDLKKNAGVSCKTENYVLYLFLTELLLNSTIYMRH